MIDGLNIAVRWALYVNLMLLFGLPCFAIYGLRGSKSASDVFPLSAIVLVLSMIALPISCLGLALTATSMAGIPLSDLDHATVNMVVMQTPVGAAWLVRMAALIIIAVLVAWRRSALGTGAMMALSLTTGVALASLAWGGHGAADEGAFGIVHLTSDITHLLAAGAWLGALVALGMMVFRPAVKMTDDHLRLTHRALRGFSVAGTIIVALIILSGLANTWIVVGPEHVLDLPATRYGQLLIAKLILFVMMLGLAATNRFRLTPAFDQALKTGGTSAVVRQLRYSLILETSAALAILGLVAWLGTLEPPMSL
ncbi:MAG: copper homeostasis membrane protein CopD [Alphaproteobacteria bacterium]|nr:copper homeostasis membrane protein CopD [Alphaproteobacteria bacterium]MDE2043356.1 copper homeostasis membrane protein CopD [Alphaproteobacteria bacterium]MDE2340805.1 copper homeostasis membrane protein CopD [Alphaproteobacteria bacterium]